MFISKFLAIPPPPSIQNHCNVINNDYINTRCSNNNSSITSFSTPIIKNYNPPTYVSTDFLPMGYYQNCRGLRSKIKNLICNVSIFNYIFICLAETWLCNNINDSDLGFYN